MTNFLRQFTQGLHLFFELLLFLWVRMSHRLLGAPASGQMRILSGCQTYLWTLFVRSEVALLNAAIGFMIGVQDPHYCFPDGPETTRLFLPCLPALRLRAVCSSRNSRPRP